MNYLPRLPEEFYRADAVVHWGLTVAKRRTGWLNEVFHHRFREMIFHACAREKLVCPVYCLMPDHLHLIWMGLNIDSNQRNGMAFLRTWLEPMLAPYNFQHQAWDHVLEKKERKRGAFAATCEYLLLNPVRKKSGSELSGLAVFRIDSSRLCRLICKIPGVLAQILEDLFLGPRPRLRSTRFTIPNDCSSSCRELHYRMRYFIPVT